MKIFLSYSHKDIEIKREIKEILNELKNENYIDKIWDDEKIRHGDEFDKQIFENLIDSDIVLFIVTHNLWQSYYIPNIEIPLANKFFHKYSFPKIVPIVIEKEAFNQIYFPNLNKKDVIPQKDKNLIYYKDKEFKKILKENLIDLIKTLPKREVFKIDFYKFNNIVKLDKYVKREKFKSLKKWIESNESIAYIEGEEGVGKSILAQSFGNYLWNNDYIVIFLNSNQWKGYDDFEKLFTKYMGIDIFYDFISKFKKDIVFILDGVNERENFDKVESLLQDFNRIEADYLNRNLKFNIRLLFTTRELSNYGLSWNYYKIRLGAYSDKEFCNAINLYFNNFDCIDFPENIKDMAKYPRYFELTIKLKDRLKNVKNITRELLLAEKLKWFIEKDEYFKEKLGIKSIDDIEKKLCMFIDEKIETEKVETIFKKDYSQIKLSLKEGKIITQEGGSKVKVNKDLLNLSYALYLMIKVKDISLDNNDFKIISKDLGKYIEPNKSDIVGEIYFLILQIYYDIEFDNKNIILFIFYYMWLHHQNTSVENEKLKFIAKNLFDIYIKYLDLLETNKISNHRFVEFDIHLIKILKELWKEDKFKELKSYLYDIKNNKAEELNKKIAIISSDIRFEFLEKTDELLKNDKENKLFFKIWNNLRFAIDGKLIEKIKNENLKEVFYVLNRSDLIDGIMQANHTENIFKYINDFRTDYIDYDSAGYFPCLDIKLDKLVIEKSKNIFLSHDLEVINENVLDSYLPFFSTYDKSFVVQYIKNIHERFLNNELKLHRLRNHLNLIYSNKELDYTKKLYTEDILEQNLAIESILVQNNDYNKLLENLLKNNITSLLLNEPNIFREIYHFIYENKQLLESIENNYEQYLKVKDSKINLFINKFSKKVDMNIKEETFLFYLSILHTNKYKQDIKQYLLSKLPENDNPSVYFFLLKENFDFKDYIFDIIEMDKNRKITKDYIYATTTKERKITGYLNDVQKRYYFKLLEQNSYLFVDYTYKELKDIFEIKGVAYLLLDRKNDLLKWADDLLEVKVSYLKVLSVYKPLKKLKEINQDKFINIFKKLFREKERIFKIYGKDVDNFHQCEYDLLKIMFEVNKKKSFNTYLRYTADYGVYNEYTKYLFENFDEVNYLLKLVKYVKNDYDIMMVSLLFLRYDKKDILKNYLYEILQNENSIYRQFAISFLRWFGDEESLETIKNIWDNDKSGYVRYFAEFSYYICLKEKNFKEKYEICIQKNNLQQFSLGLLSLQYCISPLSVVIIEKIDKEEKNFKNFTPKHRIFYQKFIDKSNETFIDKFEIYGYTLKNYYAGEKLDKYKKIILNI